MLFADISKLLRSNAEVTVITRSKIKLVRNAFILYLVKTISGRSVSKNSNSNIHFILPEMLPVSKILSGLPEFLHL